MTQGDHTPGRLIIEPMDFRRIMAAWNACEGIPTEALEAGVVKDMLEALRGVVDTCRADCPAGLVALKSARAAIAKTTEAKQ